MVLIALSVQCADMPFHAVAPRSLSTELLKKTFMTPDDSVCYWGKKNFHLHWFTLGFLFTESQFHLQGSRRGSKRRSNEVTIQSSSGSRTRQNNMGGHGKADRWGEKDECRRAEWSGSCGQYSRKPTDHFTHGDKRTDVLIKWKMHGYPNMETNRDERGRGKREREKPDEQTNVRLHTRMPASTHTKSHTHEYTHKLVNLARQAEFALPVGMIQSKLGYRVICLINVAQPG